MIPVRKDKLWGLYNKNGKQVVEFKYDSIGYIASSNKDALNLLVIPDYNVLVACKNEKYTLLNSSGEELFAPVADDIYMTISGGQTYYYIMANNNQMNAIEFLDSIGIKNKNKQTEKNSTQNNDNTSAENANQNNSTSEDSENDQDLEQQEQNEQNEENEEENNQEQESEEQYSEENQDEE